MVTTANLDLISSATCVNCISFAFKHALLHVLLIYTISYSYISISFLQYPSSYIIERFSEIERVPELVQYLHQLVYDDTPGHTTVSYPAQVQNILLKCFVHEVSIHPGVCARGFKIFFFFTHSASVFVVMDNQKVQY